MKELLDRYAGLDVHKEFVVACVMIGYGDKIRIDVRSVGTRTDELEDLGGWLKENGI